MADITITLQAASDAIMTTTGHQGDTALDDGDARKAFGIPNISIVGTGEKAILQWNSPRWDEVGPADFTRGWASYSTSGDGSTKPNPTTTAFQLRCDQISHEFQDMVAVSPIPAMDVREGSYEGSGTPGQLNQLVLAMGQRTETIKLSGMLVDRGPITAANPRRQTLLNIARIQHFKTARVGRAGWGGQHGSPLNPRSYTCLKIYTALATPGFSMGKEPSGDSRQYRGIIKDLSFRMEGGRPDMWTWNMTFVVVSNEHTSLSIQRPIWTGDINRIRLVDDYDGSGDEIEENDTYGYIEVRTAQELSTFLPNGDIADSIEDNDAIRLSGTNSLPTLNGEWRVSGVNLSDRTFIIYRAFGNIYGESAVETTSPGVIIGNRLQMTQSGWTDGNDGVGVWTFDYRCYGVS